MAWVLLTQPTARRTGLPALYFGSSEAALAATLGLWKRGLRPTMILGPDGAVLSLAAIKAYQAADFVREIGCETAA